jgi:predicted HTH transcriptional regulator
MPLNPRLQFESPDWTLLTAPRIEGQYFERKVTTDREKLAEAISAFANSNPEGGLIVNGIADDGTIKGLDYLGEARIQELLKCVELTTHRVESKIVPVRNQSGQEVQLLFIYVPFSERRVVETHKGKAFKRVGYSTIELRDEEKRELEYTKGQIQFEDEPACPLIWEELDSEVLRELLPAVREKNHLEPDTEDLQILLNRHLAILREGIPWLTNAGLLLLYRDSRRLIPGAYVRFLRYTGLEERFGGEQNLVKDEFFSGPIPRVFHRLRDFVKAQLREFSFRGSDGLFVTEPEYPEEVWEEAIINALAHRSYSFRNVGIHIRMFDDRFEVVSPGDYPLGVNPEYFISNPISSPRNPHLMNAMLYLGLVKMIHEGTRRMALAMSRAGLPTPEFSPPGRPNVAVVLRNDIDRQSATRGLARTTGFANLFALRLTAPPPVGPVPEEGLEPPDVREIKAALVGSLTQNGLSVDSFLQRRFVDFRREHIIPILRERKSKLVSLYPGAEFRVFQFGLNSFLCLDPVVEVRNRATVDRLAKLIPGLAKRRLENGFVRTADEWKPCKILAVQADGVLIELWGERGHQEIFPPEKVLPNIPSYWMAEALQSEGVRFDLFKEVKRLSLSDKQGEARHRADQTRRLAVELKNRVFPLQIRNYEITLSQDPEPLEQPSFELHDDLVDPNPVFNKEGHSRRTVLEGLTELGSYAKPGEEIPLAVLCTQDVARRMEDSIEAIRRGSMRYRGLERTFRVSLGQPQFILADRCEQYATRLQEFEARSRGKARPFFLVYAPERAYSRADYEAPYYRVKHFLLEHGYPSQMMDEDTIADPKMKELNLALDIFAKSGYVPWVLAEGLPGADLFIGLSFSSIRTAQRIHRVVGYVNVFDRYGRWQYYRSGTTPIDFERRTEQFRELVRQVTSEYQAHGNLQRLHIHHGTKLRREDRQEIAAGVLDVAPEAEVSFVRINDHTLLRLYDARSDGDGSLKRGAYVISSGNQFYISTTGYNEIGQKALGTPQALEVTVHRVNSRGHLDLRSYAQHVLSLTKLNWGSSRTFCRDPITLKFASDIAYLMNVFLAAFGGFRLHPDLERTAWFL